MAETTRVSTQTSEWWDVEWTKNCTTCGYESLEAAQSAARKSVHADTHIVRVIHITTRITERVIAPEGDQT